MAFLPNSTLAANDEAWRAVLSTLEQSVDAMEAEISEQEAAVLALEDAGGGPVVGPDLLIPNPNTAATFGPTDTVYRIEDVGSSAQSVSWKYPGQSGHRIYLGGLDATMGDSVYISFGGGYANFYYVVGGVVSGFTRGSAVSGFDKDKTVPAGTQMDATLDTTGLKLYVGGALVHTVPAASKDYPQSSLQVVWPGAAPGKFAGLTQGSGIKTPAPTTGTVIPGVVLSGGVTIPLIVKSMRLDENRYPLWDIVYNDTPSFGYGQQIERTDTSVVIPSAATTVVSNPSAGIATLRGTTRVNERGAPFVYVLQRLTGNGTAPTITRSERRTLAPVPTQGSNVIAWTAATGPVRIFKNILRQAYIQVNFERDSGGGQLGTNGIERPDILDDANNPLVNGVLFQTHVPHGTYTMEVTWTDGDMSLDAAAFNNGGSAEALKISNVVKTARSTRFDVVCDRSKATNIALFVTLTTNGIGTAKPKNLHCHILGESYSVPGVPPFANGFREGDHFDERYIALERRLGGYHRFMDAFLTNSPDKVEPYVAWSKRSRIHCIANQPCGPSFEEIILFCKLTDRPLWWNINPAYFYSAAGQDSISRAAKMLDAGTGSDLGYGLPASQKIKVECGNEEWNSRLANFHYLVRKAKEAGRWTAATTNGGADINQYERVYKHVRTLKIIQDAVPNFGTRITPVMNVQMGRGDVGGLRNVNKTADNDPNDKVTWADCLAVLDRFAKAPYVPGDPYANFSPTDQPKSKAPADVVAWADTYVDSIVATINSDIEWHFSEFNLPTDLYEWNWGQAAVKDVMTPAEVRTLKNSEVFRSWLRTRVFPGLLPNGGDACIYYDIGFPDGGSWQAFEAFWPGAANGTYEELVAYNAAQGWRVPA